VIRVVPFDPVCFQNGSYCTHGRLSGTAVFYKILDDGSGPKVDLTFEIRNLTVTYYASPFGYIFAGDGVRRTGRSHTPRRA